ncbi:MAG: GTPase HflX [Clostridia bacterium]|nr:GTPase HflX [Clostridia bacterium]
METQNERSLCCRGVLVGVEDGTSSHAQVLAELKELSRLLDTAGGETVAQVIQNKSTPDPRTWIGSGKVKEIAELCEANEVDLVIFDTELSPSQIRNLEDGISEAGRVRVIDRSMLILDIFALHATTGEGKLQVELAQLRYTAPRLIGKGTQLSRQGGGIGTRGPGESQLESDRRHIQRRIRALEEELELLDKNRRTMRASRDRSGLSKIAIVGYTNAGKSTLLNRLTDAGILAEDKLFATLDPTTRKFELPSGESILLTDTVGLIRKLPHHLIQAFRSTLDEAVYADMLMIVIDASDPECREQLEVTRQLLADLGAADKPTLYVFNKCDRGIAETLDMGGIEDREDAVRISAVTGEGTEEMIARLEQMLSQGKRLVKFIIPNAKQGLLNTLYTEATVKTVEYGAEAVTVEAVVDSRVRGMLAIYEEGYRKPREEWED